MNQPQPPIHWNSHAVHWDLIGPPLRPAADDLEVVRDTVTQLQRSTPDRGLDVLILGVTVEYARFGWPATTRITALEKNEAMVEHVWPGVASGEARVVSGDWLDAAALVGPCDLILGDGVFSQLQYPDQYDRLCRQVSQILRPEGRWVVRLYAGETPGESSREVFAQALAGRLPNVSEFKLRLMMALCAEGGMPHVAVSHIWTVWDRQRRENPAVEGLWSVADRQTIENYRDSPVRYSFPPASRVIELVSRWFAIERQQTPGYSHGASCPTLVLSPRGQVAG